MTSRELNRKWRPYEITIEYQGYVQHGDGKAPIWVVYHTKYGYATRCWSLEQADEEAKYLRQYIKELEEYAHRRRELRENEEVKPCRD